MKFIPDDLDQQSDVPFLEDARADDGWKGQSTNKSIEQLRAEISAEIGRLGGTMTRFMRGEYEIQGQTRPGALIEYSIVSLEGRGFQGRIDVAGLPFEKSEGRQDSARTNRKRRDKSLQMALFNVREGLQGARILQTLSPGYAALVPWLLTDSGQTFGQLWREGLGIAALPAPSKDGEVVDAEFKEIND